MLSGVKFNEFFDFHLELVDVGLQHFLLIVYNYGLLFCIRVL